MRFHGFYWYKETFGRFYLYLFAWYFSGSTNRVIRCLTQGNIQSKSHLRVEAVFHILTTYALLSKLLRICALWEGLFYILLYQTYLLIMRLFFIFCIKAKAEVFAFGVFFYITIFSQGIIPIAVKGFYFLIRGYVYCAFVPKDLSI